MMNLTATQIFAGIEVTNFVLLPMPLNAKPGKM
jgi:hypothetical protein